MIELLHCCRNPPTSMLFALDSVYVGRDLVNLVTHLVDLCSSMPKSEEDQIHMEIFFDFVPHSL